MGATGLSPIEVFSSNRVTLSPLSTRKNRDDIGLASKRRQINVRQETNQKADGLFGTKRDIAPIKNTRNKTNSQKRQAKSACELSRKPRFEQVYQITKCDFRVIICLNNFISKVL